MTTRTPARGPEDLLAHVDCVRRLARSLVRDQSTADDVAGDALLAALQLAEPPRTNWGAWLAGTARDLAKLRHRGEARRDARERVPVPRDGLSSPREIVERLELLRAVVDAVLALDEPYRGTVVHRYFDGLSASEIAERMGVPVETVRTRLKRALAQLRSRLACPGVEPVEQAFEVAEGKTTTVSVGGR